MRALGQMIASDFFGEDLFPDFDWLDLRIRFVKGFFMIKKLARSHGVSTIRVADGSISQTPAGPVTPET